MMKLVLLAALCMVAAPGVARAAGTGFSTTATISNLDPRDVGFDIVLTGATSPAACTNAGLFRILPTAQNYNAIVAGLISAFAMGKQLYVYTNGCDTDGATLFVAAYISR